MRDTVMLKTEASEVLSHFMRESGSKVWPSTDPNDSPLDKFTCKRCGEAEYLEAYGVRPNDAPPFEEVIVSHLRSHLAVCAMKDVPE